MKVKVVKALKIVLALIVILIWLSLDSIVDMLFSMI